MITITLTPQEYERARQIGTRRQALAEKYKRKCNLDRKERETSLNWHIDGAAGELAVKKYLGAPDSEWHEVDESERLAKTPDLAGFIDAKTVRQPHHKLLVTEKTHMVSWAYVLVWKKSKLEYVLRGWQWGVDITEWVEPTPGWPCLRTTVLEPMESLLREYRTRNVPDSEIKRKALGLVLPHFNDAKVTAIRDLPVQDSPERQQAALGANKKAPKLPEFLARAKRSSPS